MVARTSQDSQGMVADTLKWMWHLQRGGHHGSNTCIPTGICSQSHPPAGERAQPRGNDPWAQIHRDYPPSPLLWDSG